MIEQNKPHTLPVPTSAARRSMTVSKPETVEVTPEDIELLAQITEAGGNKAAAFTLRSVGAVGTVLEAQTQVLARHRLNATPSRQDGLREALERLLVANDELAATRSTETYLRMIDVDKASEQLAELDGARVNAAAALSDTPPPDNEETEAKVWRVICWDADEEPCEFNFTSRAEYDCFMASLPKGAQVSDIHEGYQHTAAYALETLASAFNNGGRCAHEWRYCGTDCHGSHKGEDSYKCAKCNAYTYNPDKAAGQ